MMQTGLPENKIPGSPVLTVMVVIAFLYPPKYF